MDGEASLDVIDDPEVLSSLVDLDDVHEAGGELGVGPGLAINLDQTLLHDGLHLLHGDGVLQTVPGVEQVKKVARILREVLLESIYFLSVKVDVCFHARQIANTQEVIMCSAPQQTKPYLRKRPTGRLSPCLWGPELGFTVNTPPSLPVLTKLQDVLVEIAKV